MTPEVARQWIRIFRDGAIVLVGTFMLIFETVFRHEADWEIVAAALTCFGLPPALRWEWDRRRDSDVDNGEPKQVSSRRRTGKTVR